MKESEQELHEGAQTLECTMRGVLREQFLEKYISPRHWESLMNGPMQVGFFPEATLTCLPQCLEAASINSSSPEC
jgi:hypothetical protein